MPLRIIDPPVPAVRGRPGRLGALSTAAAARAQPCQETRLRVGSRGAFTEAAMRTLDGDGPVGFGAFCSKASFSWNQARRGGSRISGAERWAARPSPRPHTPDRPPMTVTSKASTLPRGRLHVRSHLCSLPPLPASPTRTCAKLTTPSTTVKPRLRCPPLPWHLGPEPSRRPLLIYYFSIQPQTW